MWAGGSPPALTTARSSGTDSTSRAGRLRARGRSRSSALLPATRTNPESASHSIEDQACSRELSEQQKCQMRSWPGLTSLASDMPGISGSGRTGWAYPLRLSERAEACQPAPGIGQSCWGLGQEQAAPATDQRAAQLAVPRNPTQSRCEVALRVRLRPEATISSGGAGMLIALRERMETVLNFASRSLVSQAAFVITVKAKSPTLTSPLRWTGSPSPFDY